MNQFEIIEMLNKRDFSDWKPYHTLLGFECLYLEDSWVIDFSQAADEVKFDVEFVLTEEHPCFQLPKKNERYCYKDGSIIFKNIRNLESFEQTGTVTIGPDDEVDHGNIDSFFFKNGKFLMHGQWGLLEIESDTPEVIYKKSS